MSRPSFVFYDLETSGLSPRADRIMQFAAMRTDMDLNPTGQSYNFLIKLSDDILPSPGAIKVTGITPRQTLEEGYSEAEACDIILNQIFTPQTIVVGYNNIRFDDEFLRHLFWRNLRDPYEWAYKDGRSRWDLLDVVRLTRAIRPGKINWPVDEEGRATNRLELISAENNLNHSQAHDALSDVEALIEVGRLIKKSDPKMWQYLLSMRDKRAVQSLVDLDHPQAFVYSSGRLAAEFEKTTLAYPIFAGKNSSVVVFNLRYDPADLLGLSPIDLASFLAKHSKPTDVKSVESNKEADRFERRVYFKALRYNRCPAVAPIGVMRPEDYKRIGIDPKQIAQRVKILQSNPQLIETIKTLYGIKDRQLEKQFTATAEAAPAEERLYDDFLPDEDRRTNQKIVALSPAELADFKPQFSDERMRQIYLGYKARSFPQTLSEAEVLKWEQIRAERIQVQAPTYLAELEELAKDPDNEFIVEELKLWLENLWPGNE